MTTRSDMVREQLVAPDDGRAPIRDPRVIAAMGAVKRTRFIPTPIRALAYTDQPLPIGSDQTISQPYIAARVAELAGVGEGDKVLEVGTGSGYLAAVFAALGAQVWTVEIHPKLAARAERALAATGYDQVRVKVADGFGGWPDAAPFDAIVLSAAPERVPPPLLEQLAVGGRLVVPEGAQDDAQMLRVYRRGEDGEVTVRDVVPVAFVPMTGRAEGTYG